MGYSTTIIEVGPDASDFLAEQMAITFAGNAPEEMVRLAALNVDAVITDVPSLALEALGS